MPTANGSSATAPARNDHTEITVVGADRTGIVAEVTGLLFERGVNIEDIEQSVRDGVFRMTLHADATPIDANDDHDRQSFRDALIATGEDLGVDVRTRFPDERDEGVAVLVTKEDHCLRALCESELGREEASDAAIRVVIGNHPDLESVAAEHDVPFHDVGDDSGVPDEARLLNLLDEYDVDLVVLARFMRILSPDVVFRYPGRIINVHPSLLPAFPGAQAYRQAVEENVRIAGVTTHYVTTDLDQGPVITQRAFDVPPGATVADLKRRGQPLEAEALVAAVRAHLAGDVTVRRGRVAVDGDHQYGMPATVADANPDHPVDAPPADD